jgi:hypothetical protein
LRAEGSGVSPPHGTHRSAVAPSVTVTVTVTLTLTLTLTLTFILGESRDASAARKVSRSS